VAASPRAGERDVNPWLIAVVVSLAAFMEVLDTSIANVALPHIAGDLGASNDESTWVLTSYLVSNAIVLPISGWFVGILGRKRFFMICIAVFTVSSLLCGVAWSLGLLLLARIIQGAGGGGLQPMAQAILADSFPPEKRGLAFSVYGFTAIVAPSIGPTLGGWITDNYSWRWIFYINLPVGLVALYLVYRLIEDPAYISRNIGKSLRVDYIGFGLLALGVGALQILLDKGQEDDWFGSRFITSLAITAVVCLVTLVFYEWFQQNRSWTCVCSRTKFLRRQHGDVYGGGNFVRIHGADAAVSTNIDGIYSRDGGSRHVRGRHCSAVRASYRGAADNADPGALPDRVRMADAVRRDVLLNEANRSAD
jgi:DHA2 family multidrug resistance protein